MNFVFSKITAGWCFDVLLLSSKLIVSAKVHTEYPLDAGGYYVGDL